MSKIEFYHRLQRCFQDKATFALQLPDGHEMANFIYQWLKSPKNNKPTKTFKFGKSRVHKDDNYCKKVGREVALKNMEFVEMSLVAMSPNSDGTLEIAFSDKNNRIVLHYSNFDQPVIFIGAYVI